MLNKTEYHKNLRSLLFWLAATMIFVFCTYNTARRALPEIEFNRTLELILACVGGLSGIALIIACIIRVYQKCMTKGDALTFFMSLASLLIGFPYMLEEQSEPIWIGRAWFFGIFLVLWFTLSCISFAKLCMEALMLEPPPPPPRLRIHR